MFPVRLTCNYQVLCQSTGESGQASPALGGSVLNDWKSKPCRHLTERKTSERKGCLPKWSRLACVDHRS